MSRDILLTQITPDPVNARKHFDPVALAELADSIKATGLAVPILLRPSGDKLIIVHGERRFRAISLLGWTSIQAEVRELTADEASWLALVENIQRSDLSPVEEAQAYKAKLDQGLTQTALAKKIGKTQSYIAQKLRLLTLPAPVQYYLSRGAISEGHARQLLRLREFCGDSRKLYDITNFDRVDKLSPDIRVLAVTLLCRPWENPEGIYTDDTTKLDLHCGALDLLIDYVTKHNFSPPSWGVTAYWWAAFAVHNEISVGELDQWIDYWIIHIWSALFASNFRLFYAQEKLEAYQADLIYAGIPSTHKTQRETLDWLEGGVMFYPSGWTDEQIEADKAKEGLNANHAP